MTLYQIEYIIQNGQRIICLSVGEDERDVVEDIMSVIGSISVLSMSPLSEVHRLTKTIRRHIQMSENMGVRKGGRPRKYDHVEV